MEVIEGVNDIEERQFFGYIDSPFLPRITKMMEHILFFDYKEQNAIKPKGWTYQLLEDITSELQRKPNFTVAISIGPDMEIRATECLTQEGSLSNALLRMDSWEQFSATQKNRLHEFLQNCQSAILIKSGSNVTIATKFSLRRMLRYTKRISQKKFRDINPDPFMCTLLRSYGSKWYNYRLRATASWGNDTTLHYYGTDPFSTDILHYSSSDHTAVMYVAAAHRAAVINNIYCAYPFNKEE